MPQHSRVVTDMLRRRVARKIHKSWASRTRKGKSLAFMMIVLVGYIAGIAKVLVSHTAIYMLIPYTLNTTLVLCDLALYYRNYRIDSGLHVPF